MAGLSPPLKKGDLGGFQVLIKIPPDPPLGKGGKKTCFSDVTLIMKKSTSSRGHTGTCAKGRGFDRIGRF